MWPARRRSWRAAMPILIAFSDLSIGILHKFFQNLDPKIVHSAQKAFVNSKNAQKSFLFLCIFTIDFATIHSFLVKMHEKLFYFCEMFTNASNRRQPKKFYHIRQQFVKTNLHKILHKISFPKLCSFDSSKIVKNLTHFNALKF